MTRPVNENELLAYVEKHFVPKYGEVAKTQKANNLLKQDRFRIFTFSNGTVVTFCKDYQNHWMRTTTKVAKTVAPALKKDEMTFIFSRRRALELGLLTCGNCGYPENNHFDLTGPCAHDNSCFGYKEVQVRRR